MRSLYDIFISGKISCRQDDTASQQRERSQFLLSVVTSKFTITPAATPKLRNNKYTDHVDYMAKWSLFLKHNTRETRGKAVHILKL
jgi:hypothetical protein